MPIFKIWWKEKKKKDFKYFLRQVSTHNVMSKLTFFERLLLMFLVSLWLPKVGNLELKTTTQI